MANRHSRVKVGQRGRVLGGGAGRWGPGAGAWRAVPAGPRLASMPQDKPTTPAKRTKSGRKRRKRTKQARLRATVQAAHLSEQKAVAKRVALAAIEGELFPEIGDAKKRAYVIGVMETGNRTQAAIAAGLGASTPYSPQWRNDEALQAALVLADEAAADLMESEAYRRGVSGVDEEVGWYKGEPGGMIRRYSDILLIFLLKGIRPEKYRERMELRGALANLDLSRLPDPLIERLARGEHPMAVLASWADTVPEALALPPGPPE